jgi:hypothetical protein
MEMVEMGPLFPMFSIIELYLGLKTFLIFFSGQWDCWIWWSEFVGLAYKGKDIVFIFKIEYSSLMDFGLYVVGLFLYEDF